MRKGTLPHRKPPRTTSVKSLDELIGIPHSTASFRLKQTILSAGPPANTKEQSFHRNEWEGLLSRTLGDEAVKFGSKLLSQQHWLWGRDVLAKSGNLLLGYGFSRHAIPQGRTGCSCYSLQRKHGGSIGLWGFGIFFGNPEFGGMYLRRFEFFPRSVKCHRLEKIGWCEQDLMEFQIPAGIPQQKSTLALLAECCDWIASYEDWGRKTFGEYFRQEGLDQWSSPVCQADAISGLWREMGQLCRGTISASFNDSGEFSSG